MTTDDDALRARLARLDPAGPGITVEPLDGPRAANELERLMQIDPRSDAAAPARRRPWLIGAAAAAVTAVALGAAFLLGGGDDGARPPTVPAKAKTTLALTAPAAAGGLTMQSCLPFDVAILRDMPVAFGGTVTSVQPGRVTLKVDRWYKGGTADEVTVSTPDAAAVSIGGVDFAQGQRYLVTATEGTVNSCGFSGPATPGLTKSFEQAFGG